MKPCNILIALLAAIIFPVDGPWTHGIEEFDARRCPRNAHRLNLKTMLSSHRQQLALIGTASILGCLLGGCASSALQADDFDIYRRVALLPLPSVSRASAVDRHRRDLDLSIYIGDIALCLDAFITGLLHAGAPDEAQRMNCKEQRKSGQHTSRFKRAVSR